MEGNKPRRGCRGCGLTLGAVLLAGAVLVVGLGIAVFAYTRQKPASGILTELQGIVQARKESDAAWTPATNNQSVSGGDRVNTGAASAVTIVFFDASTVRLDENTEVSLLDAYSTRSGEGGNLAVETWAGRTNVRMVRFADPTSEFTVETPTASTTIRGADVDVEVGSDGNTNVSVNVGSAEVNTNGTPGAALDEWEVAKLDGRMRLVMLPVYQGGPTLIVAGQQATIGPGGTLNVTQFYTPSPDALLNALEQAYNTPGGVFTLILTEQMVNDYLQSVDTGLGGYGVEGATVWFSEGSVVIGGQFNNAGTSIPFGGPFTLVTTPSVGADGKLHLGITSANIGGVPLPAGLITQFLSIADSALQSILEDSNHVVQFTSVTVQEGSLTLQGTAS